MKIILSNITKKTLAYFMAFIMAVPLVFVPTTVYGASFRDIRGHWAEAYVTKAVSYGFVKGYPDGTYKPDDAVSRAEFTSMINKALGITNTASVNFKDVPYNEWYYGDVAKGISAAYAGGYDDNTFRPNNAVTREEAAVMISRFVPTYGVSGNTSTFKDRLSISTWASDAVAKIYGKGYMGAYDDGKYHPQDSLTRAQTAKILCSILDKESIVSASTTITSRGSSISGRIYSNNVTMHSDLGNGDAEVSNCMVLGNLYVYGGGENSITVSNSRIANAYVERNADTVRLLAKGQTTINKASVGKNAILETSGLSGGISGTGFNNVDIKSSTEATLRGSFAKVNLIGSSADVTIESGSVTTLNVSSSARSSTITVDNNASIGTADVNASVAFKGSGSINTMNVNSSGITYETKPRNVKLGSGISAPNVDDEDDDYDISVDPKHKATKVKVNTEITLTFDTAVTAYDGSTIRNSDVTDLVYLREKSSSGSKVSCSGSISSTKKTITLTPDKDLDDDTKYYVVVAKNNFLDTKDKGNVSQTTYFSTGDESDDTVSFSPRSNHSDVSRSVEPTITFDEAIETYSGRSINDSYIDDSVIIFRENNSSGARVPYTGSINSSKKTITIEPRSTLKEGQKYYLAVVTKKLRTQKNSTNIGSSSVTWSTVGTSAPTASFWPANGTNSVALASVVTINFSSAIYNSSGVSPSNDYLLGSISFRNDSTGQAVPYTVSYSSNSATLKPNSPLVSGNQYTVSILSSRLKSSTGVYMNSTSNTFTALVDVNLNNLTASINSATAAKAAVKVSVNGSDVFKNAFWVTQAQMDALSNAINVANAAKATVKTTPDADAASRVLDGAITAFNSAKKAGTKESPNTASLVKSISDAETALQGVVTSNEGLEVAKGTTWVNQGVMSTFTAALSTAKTLLGTVQSTAEALSATLALDNATRTFNGAKQSGLLPDKSQLKSEVSAATTNYGSVAYSIDGTDVSPSSKWVSPQVQGAYMTAIIKASGIADSSNVTQDTVNAALSELKGATATFDGAKKDGTKPEIPPVTTP